MYDELRGNLMAQATHFSVHDETSLLLLNAADAIEDLQKQLDNAEIENIKLKEEFTKYRGENRWIPVAERLPDKNGWYLTFVCNKWQGSLSDQTISIWDGKRFHVGSFAVVTHWIPLPEPPRDGE